MQCVYPPTRIEYCMRDSLNAPHRLRLRCVYRIQVQERPSVRQEACLNSKTNTRERTYSNHLSNYISLSLVEMCVTNARNL